MRGKEKLNYLASIKHFNEIEWQRIIPDKTHNWLTENLLDEFKSQSFFPMGSKDAKAARSTEIGGAEIHTIFKLYSPGVQTNRDSWMYDFDEDRLAAKANGMINTYNIEVTRWLKSGSPENIDSFVLSDETKIKWSSRLKECLRRGMEAHFRPESIRHAMYRPFVKQFLYFDNMMNHRQGIFLSIFPKVQCEQENIVIWLKVGAEWPTFALAVNVFPDLLPQGASQCFPLYTYAENGTNRRENITDWALKRFQDKYGPNVTKWDIFHYVYAMLHHPQYRERYAENLKRDLPHIPLLHRHDAFLTCVRIGERLMHIHLNYEQAKDTLEWLESKDVPFSWRVEKMHLSTDRRVVVVNESLRLGPLPPECFEYRLGNRSALEWVLDQYQVSKDQRSGIESDPNRLDDEEYIVRLVGKVVTVSVETVKLVNELAQAVTMKDWMEEVVQLDDPTT